MATDDESMVPEQKLLNVEVEVQFYNHLGPLILKSVVGDIKDGEEVVANVTNAMPGGSIIITNIRDDWTAIVNPVEVFEKVVAYLEAKAEGR